MHTKPLPKIHFITLGCAKNIVDSERIVRQLQGNGCDVVHNGALSPCDVVIVNTCGFIEKAKEESIDWILELISWKKQGKVKQVYVIGCLVERYRAILQKEFPEVDAFFGTEAVKPLLKRLQLDYKRHLVGERQLSTPKHYAYLKISEGCNRKCAFCAIPLMRGRHRSLPIETLIEEARWLIHQGVKELILIAQDLSFYGIDLYKKPMLPSLVERLAQLPGLQWLRLHYLYPSGFPMELLEVMKSNDVVVPYLDIPLQHVSDRVLRRMRRGTTKKRICHLIETIRKELPNAVIRTTFLVGFPGESEKDFEELLDFMQTYRLERVGAFMYSHEEGTHAYQHYEDDVPLLVKEERYERLMQLQQTISLEWNQRWIGKRLKVLVDRVEENIAYGRTPWDSPEVDNEVIIQGVNGVKVGDFYEVVIEDALPYDLVARGGLEPPTSGL